MDKILNPEKGKKEPPKDPEQLRKEKVRLEAIKMEALLREKMLENLPTTLKPRDQKLPTPLHGYTGEKKKEIIKQGGMDRQDRVIPQQMPGKMDYIRYQSTNPKNSKKDAAKKEGDADGQKDAPKPD